MKGKKILVFDIDGVLVDPKIRLEHARKSKDFWKTFFDPKLMETDKPIPVIIDLVKKAIKEGEEVIILTGRPERLRNETISQLEKLGINISKVRIVMRRQRDYRPSYIVKPELLKEVIRRQDAAIEIYEDEEKVAQKYKALFPHAKIYLVKNGKFQKMPELSNFF